MRRTNLGSIILATCVLCVAVLAAGCSELTQQEAPDPTLAFTTLVTDDAIPAEYGRLVSVTTTEAYPGWAQLWFEKPDSSIVTVFVMYANGALRQKALEIPRS